MLTPRAFRLLVAVDFVLGLTGVGVDMGTESLLPEPLRAYLQAQSDAEMMASDWVLFGVAVALTVALLVSTVGLFYFWRPARTLYLALTIVAVALTPWLGPNVASGWAQMFNEASLTLGGLILGLVYFSPIKELFERPAEGAAVAPSPVGT